MPPRQKVSTLFSIVLEQVLYDLNDILCGENVNLKSFREKLRSTLPRDIIKIMIDKSISYFCKHGNLLDILDILLDSNCQDLCLFSNNVSFYLSIEECIRLYKLLQKHNLDQLKGLSLAARLSPRKELQYLRMANLFLHFSLYQMKNLTSVTLREICDNMALSVIGKSAKNLVYIDVTNSQLVNEEGILAFLNFASMPNDCGECCLSKIKHFGIAGTDCNEECVIEILELCQSLESFGGPVPSDLVSILEHRFPDRLFKFKEMWEEKWVSKLTRQCPFLKSVHIPLKYVKEFNVKLRELHINLDFSNNIWPLYAYLRDYGQEMENMVLLNQNPPICFGEILELCPNLRSFIGKVTLQDPVYQNHLLLEKLEMTSSSSEITFQILRRLPNLKHLTFTFEEEPYQETSRCIDTKFLENVLLNGFLRNLEFFRVATESGLTRESFHSLVNHCPSLTFIGDLSNFSDLNEVDFEDLKEFVFQNNYNLELQMYGSVKI
ncbi:uncharacterized protein LOC136037213 isoform X1 [Artemia franciscana]|uniref:Uncharacterized protein n=1 Tax=Artemia franciscana TaxID=6661 RepID=A0AA88I1J2_ARTSF|nr:hypothetical protein QYM36_004932 [Artemia franciscana]